MSLKKNASAIGEEYPKLILSVEECSWCQIIWEQLYRGETVDEIGDCCKKCGRCVACCSDEGVCNV